MNLIKLLLCFLCLSFYGCAEIGLKPHKPSLKSTREISKLEGTYSILSVVGNSPEINKVLNNDLMKCNKTTFSMPRGNTVGSFIKEVFEQELGAAKKLSMNGLPIEVVVKSLALEYTDAENGVWTIDIDYSLDGKTFSVKNIIEFESKVSILSSCINTANVFEDALADNFVDFVKKKQQ